MIRQNLHTHTVFDDGKNTPAEMAQAAVDAGLKSLGFSGHSVLPFDNEWALTEARLPEYRAAIAETAASFAGRLEIYCGLEWDTLSDPCTEGYDYIIGSIHHIELDGAHPSVDESTETTRAALKRFFGGDAAAMAEAYFAQYALLADNAAVDIVGHFDLITKFNEKAPLFDTGDPRYIDAAMAGMETLVKAEKIFEVNTGAMSRGWRTSPYPSRRLLDELKARNGRVLVTADAHAADTVAYGFDLAEALLRQVGFRELWQLGSDGFFPVPL